MLPERAANTGKERLNNKLAKVHLKAFTVASLWHPEQAIS
jgi:hypothetical protein